MEIDATNKNQEKNSRLEDMVKTDQDDLKEKGTPKAVKPNTDHQVKYQRPNYLLRLL